MNLEASKQFVCVLVAAILVTGIMVAEVYADKDGEGALPVAGLGSIVPGDSVVKVSATPGSLVKEHRVKRGDTVKQDAVLAVLMRYDLMLANVAQAEAEMDIAAIRLTRVEAGEKVEDVQEQQAVVNQRRALWLKAQKDLDRHKELRGSGAISQAAYDQVVTDLRAQKEIFISSRQRLNSLKRVRGEDVDTADSELDAAFAALERARAELELQLIRAPMDGTILDISTYPGEVVSEKEIFLMGDLSRMQVEAEIDQADIPRVTMGAQVQVAVDGFAEPLKGTVSEIGQFVDSSSVFPLSPAASVDRRIVKVRILLEAPEKVKGLSNSLVEVLIQP